MKNLDIHLTIEILAFRSSIASYMCQNIHDWKWTCMFAMTVGTLAPVIHFF